MGSASVWNVQARPDAGKGREVSPICPSSVTGRSCDDITNICRDAAMNGMRRNIAGRTPAEIKKLREMGQASGAACAQLDPHRDPTQELLVYSLTGISWPAVFCVLLVDSYDNQLLRVGEPVPPFTLLAAGFSQGAGGPGRL
jgi:hypothetical protein